MPIVMRCPGCKTQFEFTDNLEGKRIKCKTCGDIFRVDRPSAKSSASEDDDRPVVRSASRRREDEVDDRPSVRRREDDNDLPSGRYRRQVDDEDDRPTSRSRRPDDDEERPTSRSRRPDNDEDEDDRPRRRRDEDDEDEPAGRKKVHSLLIVGPIAALALIVAAGVIIFLTTKSKKKGGPDGEGGDLVKAPAKSCPLELPEKDLGMLVLPDGGNTFGFLRKKEDKANPLQKSWTFDMYDLAAGRRLGRIDLTDMDEPRAVSLSPDGKTFLVMEAPGFGASPPTISIWSVSENKARARKWNPYPSAKGGFDAPSAYRAEFVGNDKLITLSTARFVDVWPLPALEPKVEGVNIPSKGDHLGRDDRFGQNTLDRYQRQSAFSADHKLLAVWTGSRIAVVGTTDGEEVFSTGSMTEHAKEWWPRISSPDRVKPTSMAFSPDGRILAAMMNPQVGNKDHVLALWDLKNPKPPNPIGVPTNQLNDAPAIYWWGNRYVVTHGAKVEGMLIDTLTGQVKRQLMGPRYSKYGFGRDGRLWYAVSDELKSPATMYVVEGIEPDRLIEPNDYEQIVELKNDFFLRRLWMEKVGIMRQQTDPDPSLRQQRLIRQQ